MKRSSKFQDIPLDMVGSTVFGRYPKISVEQTLNMIISDNWLVPYAGYKVALTITPTGFGRGIFVSTKFNRLIIVIDSGVYAVDSDLTITKINNIGTYTGDVFMDENEKNEIAICDKKNIYIYNYVANTFITATLDFVPGYVCYQDGYFIAPALNSATFRLCSLSDSTNWPAVLTGGFQTKPDIPVATLRFPGRGNLLLVFGSNVTEFWVDIGAQPFPYQKQTSINIDYGCMNAATIATSDNIVVWLGANERSGPVIMYTTGGDVTRISNDGIDFKLSQLDFPENSYGFLFKQDGHLIYQITFYKDDTSFMYDFTTQKFFTVTDSYQNYHIAKRVGFFNTDFYFISINDGNLYVMGTQFTDYNGLDIPRIRICKNVRLEDTSRFIVNNHTFPIEQGYTQDLQAVDLSISTDGGYTFSSSYRTNLAPQGYRANRLVIWVRAQANDYVPQFRFWSHDRFVVGNGVTEVYQ
jgi:hypothetical protein